MKIETHFELCQVRREFTLQLRLKAVDGFMKQTDDRTLLCELRALRSRLVKGTKYGKHSKEARARSAAYMQDKNDKSRLSAKNGRAAWSPDDERLIMESSLKDEELAKLIGRSMKAITRHRSKLRSKFKALAE